VADDLDRELARRFADLKRSDAAAAPSLREVLDRPIRRGLDARRPRRAIALQLAAALALLLAAFYVARPSSSGARRRSAIAAWRSPTASLLETPGREILVSTPVFGDSAPGWSEGPARPSAASPDPSLSPPQPLEKGASS